METVGSDSAIVIWRQDFPTTESFSMPGNSPFASGNRDRLTWEELRSAIDTNQTRIDAACVAVLAGPIRFNLNALGGFAILLPHLAMMKNLTQTLGNRTLLDIHDGNLASAFTNLLAATRLVTAWEPEPAEVSQLVRFANTRLAFTALWQALQTNGWSDLQLARLQSEWETPDYFKNLPETAAFKRASAVAMCRLERGRTFLDDMPANEFIKATIRHPDNLGPDIKQYFTHLNYVTKASYEDEKNLLFFYRDRELELRHAVEAPTWMAMRQLPGVTNHVPFMSTNHSRFQSLMNMRELGTAMQKGRAGLLGRAAEAESRRRIIITALALERYHGKYGTYPQALAALAPEFVKAVPVDFMDGQPLRYRLTDDGRFMLYSVGLDGEDNGGQLRDPKRKNLFDDGRDYMGQPREPDLVWPLPASAATVSAQRQVKLATARANADAMEDLQAAVQWNRAARHQADVEKVLAAPDPEVVADLDYGGHPLSAFLRNPESSGTNKLSLVDLLALKQIITGGEPETITFQAPVAYDVMTNLSASLVLLVDTNNDDYDGGCYAQQTEFERAPNGDCLLVWSTLYESPGKHALQMALTGDKTICDRDFIFGPMSSFVISNLCQFSLSSATYDVDSGALFHARLPESNGLYSIECVTTNGEHLKTLTGTTTNGQFKVVWDLMDDHGQRLGGETFNSVVHITLPDSGRTQVLRGP